MKICSRLLLVLSLILAPNLYATITCGEPKLSKPALQNDLYHFKAVVTCNMVNEKIDISALKDIYRDEMLNVKDQFKVRKQIDFDNKKGMTGYSIDATQSYTTNHGPIVVRADFIFLDDKSKTFTMDMISRSVAGEGDASYDKSIVNKLILKILPDHAELTVIKEIGVEEPWYAPEGVFFDTVEKDLTTAIRKSAPLNARKICGEKVEALRK